MATLPPTDGGGFLTGVGRVHKAVLQRVGRKVFQQDARLNMYDEVFHIVAEYLVHERGAQNDTALYRHTASDKASARAADRDGDEVVVRKAHDLRHLLGGLDKAHRFRSKAAVDGHFVMGVVRVDGVSVLEAFAADDLAQLLCELRSKFVVIRHNCISFY